MVYALGVLDVPGLPEGRPTLLWGDTGGWWVGACAGDVSSRGRLKRCGVGGTEYSLQHVMQSGWDSCYQQAGGVHLCLNAYNKLCTFPRLYCSLPPHCQPAAARDRLPGGRYRRQHLFPADAALRLAAS